jgi:formylglycine-generating enzyme required for sulfatase activity
LPTEAEWEYACRANALTPTRYSFGDVAPKLGEYGWFKGNSDLRTHPVCQKKPNGFGLYDMHGNVEEWCWDWYGEGYYSQSAAVDPTGPEGASIARVRDRGDAECRMFRGGCCLTEPGLTRSTSRNWHVPGYRNYNLGFRLALNPFDDIKDLSRSKRSGIPLSKEAKTAQPSGEAKSVGALTEGPKPTATGANPGGQVPAAAPPA